MKREQWTSSGAVSLKETAHPNVKSAQILFAILHSLHLIIDYGKLLVLLYQEKESSKALYINKYAVLASPWCSHIHNHINNALSLIREKCTAQFLHRYLTASEQIPVSHF